MLRVYVTSAVKTVFFLLRTFTLKKMGRDMSFLIDDEGNIIGTQKMVHVAQCEQFYEQSYYTPSEEGFSVFDAKIGKTFAE